MSLTILINLMLDQEAYKALFMQLDFTNALDPNFSTPFLIQNRDWSHHIYDRSSQIHRTSNQMNKMPDQIHNTSKQTHKISNQEDKSCLRRQIKFKCLRRQVKFKQREINITGRYVKFVRCQFNSDRRHVNFERRQIKCVKYQFKRTRYYNWNDAYYLCQARF